MLMLSMMILGLMMMVTIGSIQFTTWHMGERPDFVDDPLFPHSPPTILYYVKFQSIWMAMMMMMVMVTT